MTLKETLQWGEHAINDILNSITTVTINIAVKLGPWLSPAVPAYFITKSLSIYLDVNFYVAILFACSFEFVGILVISTHQNGVNWNKNSRKTDPKVPTKITFFMIVTYLIISLILSVGLELWPELSPLAIGAFVILTGVSYFTLTVLDNLTRWQDEIGEELRLSKNKAKIIANIKEFTQKLKTLTSEFGKLKSEIVDAKSSLKTVLDEVKVAKDSLQVLEEEKGVLQGDIKQLSKDTKVAKPKLKGKLTKAKSNNKKQDIADRQTQVKILDEQGFDKYQIADKLPGNVSHNTVYNDLRFLATLKPVNGKTPELV